MPLRCVSAVKERQYLPAADLFRVLCIALIAWYHFWQLSWLDPGFSVGGVHIDLQQTVRNGYMLVDMLLVLSGFLLALPYARWAQGRGDEPDGVDFYKKRFIRIVPSYLFAVLLAFFAWALPTGRYALSIPDGRTELSDPRRLSPRRPRPLLPIRNLKPPI